MSMRQVTPGSKFEVYGNGWVEPQADYTPDGRISVEGLLKVKAGQTVNKGDVIASVEAQEFSLGKLPTTQVNGYGVTRVDFIQTLTGFDIVATNAEITNYVTISKTFHSGARG